MADGGTRTASEIDEILDRSFLWDGKRAYFMYNDSGSIGEVRVDPSDHAQMEAAFAAFGQRLAEGASQRDALNEAVTSSARVTIWDSPEYFDENPVPGREDDIENYQDLRAALADRRAFSELSAEELSRRALSAGSIAVLARYVRPEDFALSRSPEGAEPGTRTPEEIDEILERSFLWDGDAVYFMYNDSGSIGELVLHARDPRDVEAAFEAYEECLAHPIAGSDAFLDSLMARQVYVQDSRESLLDDFLGTLGRDVDGEADLAPEELAAFEEEYREGIADHEQLRAGLADGSRVAELTPKELLREAYMAGSIANLAEFVRAFPLSMEAMGAAAAPERVDGQTWSVLRVNGELSAAWVPAAGGGDPAIEMWKGPKGDWLGRVQTFEGPPVELHGWGTFHETHDWLVGAAARRWTPRTAEFLSAAGVDMSPALQLGGDLAVDPEVYGPDFEVPEVLAGDIARADLGRPDGMASIQAGGWTIEMPRDAWERLDAATKNAAKTAGSAVEFQSMAPAAWLGRYAPEPEPAAPAAAQRVAVANLDRHIEGRGEQIELELPMEPGELAAALESIGVYSPDKCAELQAAGVDASDEAVVLDYDVRGILPACGAMIYEGESLEHANIAARLAASLSPEARAAAAALLGQETAPTLLEACNAFAQADEIGYMEYDVPEYLSAAPREAKLGFTLAHGEPGPDGRTLAEVLAAYGASACMDWQRYGAERAQDWALSDAGAIPADRRIDLEAIGWDEAREKAFGPTPSADRARARREPISGRGPRAAAEQAARPKADRRGAAATPKADKAAVKAQTR